MSPRRQSPLSLEYILLGFLDQGPNHGYDLYKLVARMDGVALVWHIKQSQLYALLDKLEGEGLLASSLVPGEAHPMRKEYQITPLGRQAFTAWMSRPVEHGRDMRQEFLAKLYFTQKSRTVVGLALIDGQKAACKQWLDDLQSSYSRVAGDQHYERMVFQFRISQTAAYLDWLESCRSEILEAHKPPAGSQA